VSYGVRQALLSHWLRCTGSTPRGPLPAPSSPQAPAGRGCSLLSRAGGRSDDVTHKGKKIDWGAWAITGDDPEFGGTGNPDTGADYGPAPGGRPCWPACCSGSWRPSAGCC